MTRKERNEIIKFAEKLTDEELEKEYYNAVYSSLGSQCEDMYELGENWAIGLILNELSWRKTDED